MAELGEVHSKDQTRGAESCGAEEAGEVEEVDVPLGGEEGRDAEEGGEAGGHGGLERGGQGHEIKG